MEWVGFIVLNILGIQLIVGGLAWVRVAIGFSGQWRYLGLLVVPGIGVLLMYWAWIYGPLTVSVALS